MDTQWMRDLLDRYDRLHQDIKAFNAPRDFYLALIRHHRMNAFNGPRIAAWLDDHRDHWQAVYLGPSDADDIYRLLADQAEARPMPIDALYIMADERRVDELEDVARNEWSADESDTFKAMGRTILRLWWD